MNKGMYVQLVDANGNAVRRKWFLTLKSAEAWLGWQYPDWQERYTLEIFYE